MPLLFSSKLHSFHLTLLRCLFSYSPVFTYLFIHITFLHFLFSLLSSLSLSLFDWFWHLISNVKYGASKYFSLLFYLTILSISCSLIRFINVPFLLFLKNLNFFAFPLYFLDLFFCLTDIFLFYSLWFNPVCLNFWLFIYLCSLDVRFISVLIFCSFVFSVIYKKSSLPFLSFHSFAYIFSVSFLIYAPPFLRFNSFYKVIKSHLVLSFPIYLSSVLILQSLSMFLCLIRFLKIYYCFSFAHLSVFSLIRL